MTDGYDTYSFARLREEILESAGGVDALADAGLLDEGTIDHLHSFEQHYESDPEDPEKAHYPEESDYWRRVVRREVSKNLRRAVRRGRVQEVAYAVGLTEGQRSDASGLITWEQTRSLFTGSAGNILIYTGAQGGGKTAHSLKMANLERHIHDDVEVLTNIQSAAEKQSWFRYVYSVSSLLEAVEDSDAGRIIFLLDEASSHATGQPDDAYSVGQFGAFCRKLRKQGIDMYIIGHRTTDIAPTIRDLEGALFVLKPEKTQAEFYRSADDADARENAILRHDGLTDTNLQFDTDEYTSWSWKGLDELENKEDPEQQLEAQPEFNRCRGHKAGGERCGVVEPSRLGDNGYCQYHRDQHDPDDE